ncbi:MAG: imidazoleglycerol-phosphate dehydratase [Candidatus Wildermuthbacteria bacterium RIFCSPHIGHO2_01_FULL_48_27b]|uniref:Imidazoleglycerol-phosphate dehydratase n=1 Tax=Candidatus Wildermuthbacteria bacterium RIFCSPHIGHO2_01_FULL_48_27b TaxID=1802447 RepID=A0A1G2QT28_9BACT|nr:MAG: imidazoleglycerol-phosphate dehydratase [Candidatus Wildermuthbacteria bacterium RIFCSPHIGHO2_01_FULL_48_27b]
MSTNERVATVHRTTGETDVSITLNLDGSGQYEGKTGQGFLDHMLAQIARHGILDITVDATGDNTGTHHLVEDVAIVLGQALRKAIGEGAGITRMGDATVPLDEALARCAVDLSGRPYAVINTDLHGQDVEGLPGDMLDHFLESFALEARIALHCRVLYGRNAHHKAEATFKALARALRTAVTMDPRRQDTVPSTKETIAG